MKTIVSLSMAYLLLIVIAISCVNETSSNNSAVLGIVTNENQFYGGDPRGDYSSNTPFYMDITGRPPSVPVYNDTIWSVYDSVIYNTGTGNLILNGSLLYGEYAANNFSINYLGYTVQIATNINTGGSKRRILSQLPVPILPSSFSNNGKWVKIDYNKIVLSYNISNADTFLFTSNTNGIYLIKIGKDGASGPFVLKR